MNDKGKQESAQIVLINQIEKKYKDQLKEQENSFTQKEKELLNKIRNLEREVKNTQDRYEQESGGLASVPLLEWKLHEL